jgi:UPF0755 protein
MRRLAATFLLMLVAVVAGAGWLAYQWQTPYRGYGGTVAVVDVPRGATTRAIADRLAREGVVRSAVAFELWSRWHHEKRLEAGEYRFERPMTPTEVFNTLAEGRVWAVNLTIPEGWTMFDIANAVARAGLTSRAAFLRVAENPAPIRDLAPNVPTLEGFLFPATYRIPHRTTAKAIVRLMVQRFREAWTTATRDDAPPKNLSPEKVVTLASLVQEETPKEKERPIIAGVFMNRLRMGYPLECDPSVVYALKLAGRYDGDLRPAELHVQSPYNTYLNYGLPPGPIGNPGMASLEAALKPADVKYLYFVANGTGGHSFSRTLAEHRRNVERYRQYIEREKAKQKEEKDQVHSRQPRRRGEASRRNRANGSLR